MRIRPEGEGRQPRTRRRWLGAQGRDGVGCQPMSQRFPSQPSSQMHCQGSTQSPLTQPGKVTHWSHRGPCQPGWHLQGGGGRRKMRTYEGGQEWKGSSGCFPWGQDPSGCLYQASGPQEASTSHLNGKASTEDRTEGSLRNQGGIASCRSGLQWSHPARGSPNTPTSETADRSRGCPLSPALFSPSLPPISLLRGRGRCLPQPSPPLPA